MHRSFPFYVFLRRARWRVLRFGSRWYRRLSFKNCYYSSSRSLRGASGSLKLVCHVCKKSCPGAMQAQIAHSQRSSSEG